jgi:gliding motility-associated lipoprotein GldD
MKELLKYFLFVVLFAQFSCGETYTPKPKGYFRIEFPEKQYIKFQSDAPFSFEIPKYSKMVIDSAYDAEPWWYNLNFPAMKGTIHLSYKKVNNNITKYVEDARELVNKHTIKAEAIDPQVMEFKERNVIAVLFEIKGNAATPYQFFATDSTTHFLRGSLYFNVYPNKDSLAPVVDFVKKDIFRLIETLEWKKPNSLTQK